jgi:hypothetical protein
MPIIPAPQQITPAAGRFLFGVGARVAWGAAGAVRWDEHRAALARHGRLWEQDGLTFFRAETVDWPQGGTPGQPR